MDFPYHNPCIFIFRVLPLAPSHGPIYDFLDDHNFKVPVIVECMNPGASIMSYAIMYYLVFEMMMVKNTIGSNCHKVRAKTQKRIEVTRVIVYALFFGFYASTTFWVFVMSR